MKAHRTDRGFTGLITDHDCFNEYVDGKRDWKPHTKAAMNQVLIPFDIFEYLVELHREDLERTSGKKKGEIKDE